MRWWKAQSTTDACWLLCQGLNRDLGGKKNSTEPTLRSGREERNSLLAAGRCGKADYIRIYRVYIEPTAQVKVAKSEQAS